MFDSNQTIRVAKDGPNVKDALAWLRWLTTSDYGKKWIPDKIKQLSPIKGAKAPSAQLAQATVSLLAAKAPNYSWYYQRFPTGTEQGLGHHPPGLLRGTDQQGADPRRTGRGVHEDRERLEVDRDPRVTAERTGRSCSPPFLAAAAHVHEAAMGSARRTNAYRRGAGVSLDDGPGPHRHPSLRRDSLSDEHRYSFTKWNGLDKAAKFVGLSNYTELLTDDPGLVSALVFTLVFTVLVVAATNVIALFLAVILDMNDQGKKRPPCRLLRPEHHQPHHHRLRLALHLLAGLRFVLAP